MYYKEKKIYLSGGISGRKYEQVMVQFEQMEYYLKTHGHEVVNPAKFGVDERSWEDYMKMSVIEMMSCDAILMLQGWQNSRGATIERNLAWNLNIPVYYEKEFEGETD
jgi:hypothetical protein